VSWHAQAQVRKFTAGHPGLPVYTVFVRQDRDLSNKIAEVSGIRHESPQVIVFRHGQAVSSSSHQDVTIGFLEGAIRNPVTLTV
jgi:bacillithiol system protein YtxJ